MTPKSHIDHFLTLDMSLLQHQIKDSSFRLSTSYDITTPIDTNLQIVLVFRVPFVNLTVMDFSSISHLSLLTSKAEKRLHLCNVNIDTLTIDPSTRPSQLSKAAACLCAPSIACTLLAGGLKAIQPFGSTSYTHNRL